VTGPDDEVADAGARAGIAVGRVMDELDGDERVVRQLEHAQGALRRLLDGLDDRVADGLVNTIDRRRSLPPQADVQGRV